ncbi:hypothetical protein FEE95_05300 [Maribacter algarum]|uniref:DUF2306 domain-containing protein n=1 Tax=Maribacter algarum (ex Zhang et al. 2020) TaxID=2578118 RepID=A0A5S3PV19_9FLAO|nr:hypothetical protein [Maribacter algarum]TMM58849.1 hypothetical protein FEE95_05300 [Maribacter algarum]
MEEYTLIHKINIVVHVISGSLALILAIIAMAVRKGGKTHNRSGQIFLLLVTFVIATGLIGVFVFKVNTFLLVITLLSGYEAFSGYRILKLKSNTPKLLDILVALLTMASGIYFLYYFESIGMYWSPVIIYSTIGTLFLLITYDFLRYVIPAKRYRRMWLYEHIYKMIAAFTALLSAFVGTVLPQYHPYSQFLPSIFGTMLAIAFIVYFYRKNNSARNEAPQKNS